MLGLGVDDAFPSLEAQAHREQRRIADHVLQLVAPTWRLADRPFCSRQDIDALDKSCG